MFITKPRNESPEPRNLQVAPANPWERFNWGSTPDATTTNFSSRLAFEVRISILNSLRGRLLLWELRLTQGWRHSLPCLNRPQLEESLQKLSTFKSFATHWTSVVSRSQIQSWELCVPNLIPPHGQIAGMVSLHKGLVGTQFGKLPTTDWMKLPAGTADCFGGSWEGRKIWSFGIDPLTSSDRSPCREVRFCCDKCTLSC